MRLHNRQIKGSFWSDPDILCDLTRDQRMFFIGLIQVAEDSGCLEYDTRALKILLFPIDNDITPDLLKEWIEKIISMGKLIIYEIDGKKYLYLKNFHKHQSLRLPTPTDVPLPPWINWVSKDERKRYGCYEINNELLNDYIHGHIHEDINSNGHEDIKAISKVKLSKEKKDIGENVSADAEPPSLNNHKKEISEVMDFYNQQFSGLWRSPLSLTKERMAHIRARLKNYTVEDLKNAIVNLRASPFHCGENDQRKIYGTPEFLFKNDSQVDKWLKVKLAKPLGDHLGKSIKNNTLPSQEENRENWYEEALNRKL